MHLFPNLYSPNATKDGTLRYSLGCRPTLAYLLNHAQYLCAFLAALSFLAGEGVGYARWVTIFNNRYVAVALLNQLGDYTLYSAFASFLLGLVSALLFVRMTYLRVALMFLPLALSILTPSYGMA